MISINEYLDLILEDFKEYLRSSPCLCHLKDVHYDAGRVPNYSDEHVQQFYLLRYAYAYAFEYKCMYEHLLSKIPKSSRLSVMSIGCGNMIDYWGLAQAVGPDVVLSYKGYDSVDWSYKFSGRDGDRLTLILGNAIDAIEEGGSIASDIIVFPKSISEFDHDAIDRFCECLRTKRILKDRIYLLVSLRSDPNSAQRDVGKVKKIYEALNDAGFESETPYHVATHLKFRNAKIRELDSSFEHPGDVIDLLKVLNTQCAEYKENEKNCYSNCVDRLTRWPMLSCKSLQWQFFDFSRR